MLVNYLLALRRSHSWPADFAQLLLKIIDIHLNRSLMFSLEMAAPPRFSILFVLGRSHSGTTLPGRMLKIYDREHYQRAGEACSPVPALPTALAE
jgi:hypothetical protein